MNSVLSSEVYPIDDFVIRYCLFCKQVDRGNNGHVRFDECTVEDNMANLGAGVMSWVNLS